MPDSLKKPHDNTKKIFFLLSVFISAIFFSCSYSTDINKAPLKAVNGILDLRAYKLEDWEKLGPVDLSGEWKYIANAEKAEFIKAYFDDSRWGNFEMPSHWHGLFEDSTGYYYFRLKVLLSNSTEESNNMGIALKKAYTAYALYINGQHIISNGIAGNDSSSTIPQQIPVIGQFENTGELNVVLKVSNFDDVFGGIQDAPQIGLYKDLCRNKYNHDFLHMLMIGILFIAGIYHFFFWVRRRKDKSNLFFSLCCLFIAAYLISFNSYLAQLFPQVNANIFHVSIKMDYISILLYCLVAPGFLKIFFPAEFSKSILNGFRILASALIIFVLVMKTIVFTKLLFPFVALHFFLFTWILVSLIRAAIHKKKYSVLYLISYVLLFLALSRDILKECNVFAAELLSPPLLTLSIVLQSFALTDVFIQAFKRSRYLEGNLSLEVEKQTELLNSRNIELDSILTKLKMSEQYKNNFFQNISHELRTPLTLILDPIHTINREHIKKFPTKAKKLLSDIEADAHVLKKYIEQLMDLTRIEIGKDFLNADKIDINMIYADLVSQFKQDGTADRLVINNTAHISDKLFYLDSNKITRVFQHLISNALLYSEGPVYINISTENHEKNKTSENMNLLVSIRDTGPGIPEDRLPFIFEKIKPEDENTTQKETGFGIGLYLVKKYITMHKGRIDVNSGINGTEFIVRLPMFEKHELHTEQEYEVDSGNIISSDTHETVRDEIILLVEHNTQLLSYLHNKLRNYYTVLNTGNAEEAYTSYKEHTVDMIICEKDLPDMDGAQFRQMIMKNEGADSVPFLFLQSEAENEHQTKSSDNEVIDYIEKPFNIEVLIKKIESLLDLVKIQKNKRLKLVEQEISGLIWNKSKSNSGDFDSICKHFGASEREKEIITNILEAKTNREISELLGISLATIKNHLSSVFSKFGVHSRGELIAKVKDEIKDGSL